MTDRKKQDEPVRILGSIDRKPEGLDPVLEEAEKQLRESGLVAGAEELPGPAGSGAGFLTGNGFNTLDSQAVFGRGLGEGVEVRDPSGNLLAKGFQGAKADAGLDKETLEAEKKAQDAEDAKKAQDAGGGEKPGQDGQPAQDVVPEAQGPGAGTAEDEERRKTQSTRKGGTSRHRNFVNFLATDKVPDSIFGIPIVQDESQYTEKDLEFFRRNPKAAGFYDLGDEEVDEDAPQQAVGAGTTYDTPLTKDQEARYQKWRATLPKPLQYEGDYDLRGYWLDPRTVKDGIKDGQHFTDTYKKPNHPTFSVESKYATGADLARAGRWEGEKFIPPRGAYPGSLNNPGNVEKRKERRQGEVDSPHERWAKFATPQDGLREMADAIRQIAVVKLAEKGQDFTIRNFAEVYAPRVNEKGEKENDTDKYIGDISADTGFDADEELARWDEGDMARFLRSVVKFESGAKHSAWFTDEEYRKAAEKLQEGVVD